jgi:hypothetical protein
MEDYGTNEGPPPVPLLRYMNPVHTLATYILIHFNITFPLLVSYWRIHQSQKPCVTVCNIIILYNEQLLDPDQSPDA